MSTRVLVTGAGGFIGSHLVEGLVSQGYQVRAFVRYNARNDWGWLEILSSRPEIEIYTGDIRDYDSVRDAMRGVDVVFHLAALIGIPYSYRSPQAYIRTNVEGAYNILQAAREEGARVVHTSTSEVYGTARHVPIDEEHPIQAQSPYSATKVAADQLALSFYRSFGLPVTVVRPFNTYGPRQSARAIIPTIITQALSERLPIKLGNLNPTRDLNFVQDTVDGFIAVGLSKKTVGEVVNLATGEEISIGGLVHAIERVLGMEIPIKQDESRIRPGKSEVERLCGDNRKAYELAGWKPRYSLDDGLRITADWLRHNLHLYKPDLYNV